MINAAVFWAVVLSLSMALIQCMAALHRSMLREQKAVQMMYDTMRDIIDIVQKYEQREEDDGPMAWASE